MGTDIHVVPELSWDNGESWEPLLINANLEAVEFPISRNYELFRHLAGVRGAGYIYEPIAPARGCPPDAHPMTKAAMEKNLHSVTWVSRSEAKQVFACSSNWAALVTYVEGLYHCNHVRYVIGFDS